MSASPSANEDRPEVVDIRPGRAWHEEVPHRLERRPGIVAREKTARIARRLANARRRTAIGKGTRQRAFEMSAGRRSKHHQRIVTNHLCDKRAKEAMRRAKARVQLGEVQ